MPLDEEWRPIAEFGGAYEVSSLGRVRSWRMRGRGGVGLRRVRPRLLNPEKSSLVFVHEGKCVHRCRARLVSDAFPEAAAKIEDPEDRVSVAPVFTPNRVRRPTDRRAVLARHGLTEADYDRMLLDQGAKCAICLMPESRKIRGRILSLAVDHCHAKGHVRGLLCAACNTALGLLEKQDGPERLLRYLSRTGT